MVRQTSLEAYRGLGAAKIGQRQKQVLDTLENIYPACNRRISEVSKLPINVVTPRINELRKKGLVTEAYTNFDVTGRRVIFWKPVKTEQLREHE